MATGVEVSRKGLDPGLLSCGWSGGGGGNRRYFSREKGSSEAAVEHVSNDDVVPVVQEAPINCAVMMLSDTVEWVSAGSQIVA